MGETASVEFLREAVLYGPVERAREVLAAHPEIGGSDIYVCAVLGDVVGVTRLLGEDPGRATATGGAHRWDALTYLCFSKFLRVERERGAEFAACARALLDAGASAGTGFWNAEHQPKPVWESAIYGAAGIAQSVEVTRLLLERGADPNDDETPYHVPETRDNSVLRVLVESGKLNAESLTTVLVRKADWHDHEGLTYVLRNGGDPNRMTRWGFTGLQQAIRRDNALMSIETLLDHRADPGVANRANGRTGVAMAAWRGRGDVLAAIERRGLGVELHEVDRLVAACARDDEAGIRREVEDRPGVVGELMRWQGTLLAEFAGNANTKGVARLIELGVAVDARYGGDGYFGIAHGSTALHVAAWRGWPETVRLLIARGADVNARDGWGRTALMLAVKACVDSYWTYRRSPESVAALLEAGAVAEGVEVPCGYAEVDRLLGV